MPPVREVRQYLLAFDIYLMPSLKEGLPYSLLEAGYAGLPVIASGVGGIPEVVITGETGTLTDPQNHLTITTALENIINNPNERDTLTSQMQSHIDQNFKLETMIAATQKVYCSSKRPS
jgi:glycosyltransferase involved in cell wall biosynthesis